MSLRARLAIITVVAVALALVVANVAIGRYVDDFLTDKRDEQLNGLIVPSFAALLRTQPTAPPGPAGTGERTQVFDDAGDGLDVGDVYSELRDADGDVVAARFVFGTDQPIPELPAAVHLRAGERKYFDVEAPGGKPYRVVAERLPNSGFTVLAALPVNDIEDTLQQLLLIQVGASAAVLLGVLGLAWWLTGLGLRPLRRMEGTAAAIAAGDLSQRVEPSGDRTEIARLGKSLNGMLSEIEGAFAVQAASEQRLRQFVADASHELRTPLTAVRGYAELFRRGAADDPEELPKAMRRIEEEAARMGGLVDDMLTLARLDEHRPLDAEPVDLVELSAGAVADLRALDPERPVELDAPEPLVVVGDRARLTQVIANLLANVRAHTPDATAVEVVLRSVEEDALIEVIDHGPGIDPALAASIFDRLVRADSSRTRRDGGGAGLGLAIVAAIVEAHGGTYGVRATAPGTDGGSGATFWVRVPREAADGA
jgi:two-component system, OmpR family, sensor kinase